MKSNLDTPSISCVGKNLADFGGVSAWRNYFIANEWLKLVTKRKFSMFLQVIIVSVIIMIFGFENWSSLSFYFDFTAKQTRHTDIDNYDKTLKVAVASFVYITVYLSQRLLNCILHERYVKNAIQQFVDICSMANVSVFVLYHKCFGFYLHGRSPHGFSDTDMCSMVLQLKREADNVCGYRGLMPNSNQQTYSFLVPPNFRLVYDKLNVTFSGNGPAKMADSRQTIDITSKLYEYNLEKIASAYYNMNRFLSAFIDHGLKDLDYTVQETSLVESLLDFEYSNTMTESRGIIYLDAGHSFDRSFLYGNENVLVQFELMVFLVVTVISENYLVAIVVVGAMHQLLQLVMEQLAKRNLSEKTLIDKRFLI